MNANQTYPHTVISVLAARRAAIAFFFLGLALLLGLFASAVEAQEEDIDYKERLVSTVTNWISDREAVPGAQVDVLANDRRFRVPDCSAGFTVGYVTTPTLVSNRVSNATVRVNCDETHWTAILRVNIDAQPEILIFTRDLTAGTVVIAQDIAVAGSTKTPAAEDIDEIIGRTLNRSVSAREEVSAEMLAQLVDIYITTTTIARGQAIEQQSVRQLAVDFGQASVQQRITEEQLYSAVARRNLQEGAILSLSDLQFSSTALVATTVLEQGSMFDSSNFSEQALFERLPQDAVLDSQQLRRAYTKRRLTPGDVIRYSDIKMQPHITEKASVQLTVVRGAITLTVEMISNGEGYIGDSIELRNPESGEIVMATIIGEGQAYRE